MLQNVKTKIGIITVTELFSHLNYTHHAIANYIITSIWDIVLPNSLFKRLLPFSIIFYHRAYLSVFSL